MLDAKRLLDEFLGGRPGQTPGRTTDWSSQLGDLARGLGGSNLGGIGGGALAGGLAGILLGSKQGRKLAGSALAMGGLAAVGALAYQAYKNWQTGKRRGEMHPPSDLPTLPPPGGRGFHPAQEADQQLVSFNLVRAMIGAAKADGHIDAEEREKIFAAMDRFPLEADAKSFVMEELRAPLDVDAIAKSARTLEEAVEIYVTSLLAINVDSPAERDYLTQLAARMGLDERLVKHLHASVEDATVPMADKPAPIPAGGRSRWPIPQHTE